MFGRTVRTLSRLPRHLVPGRLLRRSTSMLGRIGRQSAAGPGRAVSRTGRAVSRTVQKVTENQSTLRPSRRWTHLVVGLPGLLLAGGAVAATLWSMGDRRQLGQEYWRRGLEAIDRGNFAAAQLFLNRAAVGAGVDSREVDFAMAVVNERLGFTGRSTDIFRRLAPVNRTGFGKAHRHLAITISQQSAADPLADVEPETLLAWSWHLQHADEQASAAVRQAWGNYYLAVDDVESAVTAYSAAARQFPQLYLQIAELQGRLGRLELRTETLQTSRERYRREVSDRPRDAQARMIYATTLMALGELREAERVLQTGKRIDPEGPYDSLLASMYVQLHDQLRERDDNAARAEAIAQLRNALQIDPNFAPALNRLMSYAQVERENIPQLREILNELLVSGRDSAMAHLALSNLAWLEQDIETTKFHLRQAIGLDGKMPVIANNLAWMLAHQQPPRLEQALGMIDPVVEQFPENARFLDTRGTILSRLGRNHDALIDLEKALPAFPDPRKLHGKLAAIYADLGMSDLARQHERRASQIH